VFRHQAEFGEAELADQVARHGAALRVIDPGGDARLLSCSRCGARDATFVISGSKE
jgi:hypothetical protein